MADTTYEGQCMKCRKKVKIQDPKNTVTKNKRNMIKGKCPTCGTNINVRSTGKSVEIVCPACGTKGTL